MSIEILRRELLISRKIDEALNALVREMKEFMDDARVWDSKMEENQINNVLAVAKQTESVEVVKNYIRYQVGRDAHNENWRWSVGSARGFGERLIEKLDGLHDLATSIVAEASEQGTSPHDVDRVWMILTRAYLGHLARYFVYRKR